MSTVAARAASQPAVERDQAYGRGSLVWAGYHVALAGMMLTYVWRIQQVFPHLMPFRLPQLTTALGLAFFLITNGPDRVLQSLSQPLTRWLAAFILITVLSIPVGLAPGFSLSFITDDYGKTVMFTLMVIAGVRSLADVRRLLAVNIIGAVLYTATLLRVGSVGGDGRLVNAFYYDPNDLAMFLAGSLPLAIYFVYRPLGLYRRLLVLGAAALFLETIVVSGSRGGFLGLVTVVVGLLTNRALRGWRRFAIVGGIALVMVIAGSAGYWDKIASIAHPEDDYNVKSQSGRVEVWKRGLGYMAERPILGVGANGFFIAEGKISPMARQRIYGKGWKWSAPHNSFVEVGAEIGIPGLIVYLCMLASAFGAAWRLRRPVPGPGGRPADSLLGQSFAIALGGLIVSSFFVSQAYAAFSHAVLGMLIGASTPVLASPALLRRRAPAPVLAFAAEERPLPEGWESLPVQSPSSNGRSGIDH